MEANETGGTKEGRLEARVRAMMEDRSKQPGGVVELLERKVELLLDAAVLLNRKLDRLSRKIDEPPRDTELGLAPPAGTFDRLLEMRGLKKDGSFVRWGDVLRTPSKTQDGPPADDIPLEAPADSEDIEEAPDPAERGMGRGPLTQQEVVNAFAKVMPVFERLNEESPLVKLYRAASEEDSPHPEDTETAPATPKPRWERLQVVDKFGAVCGLDDGLTTPEAWDREYPECAPHLPLVREADAEATVRELEARLEAAEQHVLILRGGGKAAAGAAERLPRHPAQGPHPARPQRAEGAVSEPWRRYTRTNEAQLRSVQEGETLESLREAGVSVSEEDVRSGSPQPGDMIARNPANHDDQWLVSRAYFEENFAPAASGQGKRLQQRLEDAFGPHWREVVSLAATLGRRARDGERGAAGTSGHLRLHGEVHDRAYDVLTPYVPSPDETTVTLSVTFPRVH